MVIIDTSRAPIFKIMGITRKDNGIGGKAEKEEELFKMQGFLDLAQGFGANGENSNLNSFLQESTHILITDYRENITNKNWVVDSNGNRYNIVLVDDPVSRHHHLELYLKFTGDYNV